MSRHRTVAHRRLPARLGAAGLALLLVTGASGCGKAADKFSEKAAEKATEKAIESGSDGKADVDLNDGEMNIETDDGSFSMGAGGEIPDSWPEDVPMPPDAEVVSVMEMGSDDSEATINLSVTTDMPSDDVVAFYKDGLDGWTQAGTFSSNSEDGGMTSVQYERDEQTSLGITALDDEDEGTIVNLTYTVQADE